MIPPTYSQNRIFTLNEPNAPRLNPALAVEIGLNESLLLLQLEFWISITHNERDGRLWTYQSTREIQEKAFPFWSHHTINRALNSLESSGYITTTTKYNSLKYDKTRWISLNYQELSKLNSISIKGYATRSTQIETGSEQIETGSTQLETTIPEITTEITTETTTPQQTPTPLPDITLPSSFSDDEQLNELVSLLPEQHCKPSIIIVIQKALKIHSKQYLKDSILYTTHNCTSSSWSKFKAYLGKCIEYGWGEGYEPEVQLSAIPINQAEVQEQQDRANIRARHEALNNFAKQQSDKYEALAQQAAQDLNINLKKLKPGEQLKLRFKIMELYGI